MFIGLFIVPLVCVEAGDDRLPLLQLLPRNPPYRRKGAPHPVLGSPAPLLVLSTISLLGAGIVALAVGPRIRYMDHDSSGSAIAWVSLAAVHVLGHALETWRLTNAEVPRIPPLPVAERVLPSSPAASWSA